MERHQAEPQTLPVAIPYMFSDGYRPSRSPLIPASLERTPYPLPPPPPLVCYFAISALCSSPSWCHRCLCRPQIVIAMSVSSWYFARNKNHVGSLTVVSSVGKTFFYHIGTAAFGGLIVAIVEVITTKRLLFDGWRKGGRA